MTGVKFDANISNSRAGIIYRKSVTWLYHACFIIAPNIARRSYMNSGKLGLLPMPSLRLAGPGSDNSNLTDTSSIKESLPIILYIRPPVAPYLRSNAVTLALGE